MSEVGADLPKPISQPDNPSSMLSEGPLSVVRRIVPKDFDPRANTGAWTPQEEADFRKDLAEKGIIPKTEKQLAISDDQVEALRKLKPHERALAITRGYVNITNRALFGEEAQQLAGGVEFGIIERDNISGVPPQQPNKAS